jgi:acyl-coenzyme A thioesterase PaaI-like protein
MSERAALDIDGFLQAIPYARFLGLSAALEGESVLLTLHYDRKIIGNPLLPAIHGGAIGGFLEMTAIAQLVLETGIVQPPKPISITVEYLRSGKPMDTFAIARITKQGRRVGNVSVVAWQDDRLKPIAAAHGHFLLRQVDDSV